jgi:hypothetical protein
MNEITNQCKEGDSKMNVSNNEILKIVEKIVPYLNNIKNTVELVLFCIIFYKQMKMSDSQDKITDNLQELVNVLKEKS